MPSLGVQLTEEGIAASFWGFLYSRHRDVISRSADGLPLKFS